MKTFWIVMIVHGFHTWPYSTILIPYSPLPSLALALVGCWSLIWRYYGPSILMPIPNRRTRPTSWFFFSYPPTIGHVSIRPSFLHFESHTASLLQLAKAFKSHAHVNPFRLFFLRAFNFLVGCCYTIARSYTLGDPTATSSLYSFNNSTRSHHNYS